MPSNILCANVDNGHSVTESWYRLWHCYE